MNAEYEARATPLDREIDRLRGEVVRLSDELVQTRRERDAFRSEVDLLRRQVPATCPPELETATGTFDPSGEGAGGDSVCAGCGAGREEHGRGKAGRSSMSSTT